jgi:hypothetical protein
MRQCIINSIMEIVFVGMTIDMYPLLPRFILSPEIFQICVV